MGDGCSVNVKAGKDITKNLGLMSPTTHCTSQTSDGSIKRMSQSNTKSVEKVKEFSSYLRAIPQHFQLSDKSPHLLNEALSNLEMKPKHMATWCPT